MNRLSPQKAPEPNPLSPTGPSLERQEKVSSLRERARKWYKTCVRQVRVVLVSRLASLIERQPVSRIPRIRALICNLLPLFFRHEEDRARKLLPQEFRSRAEEIIRGMKHNQVMNLLEIILYEKLHAAYPDYLRMDGEKILRDAYSRGRGMIMLSGHFGNWELIGYHLAAIGLPMNVIARPQAVDGMTRLMNEFRERRNCTVLMDNNLSSAFRLLKNGKVIGIVSDLNARERGFQVPFFGRTASFYPTPVILSVRSGAPLIPIFIERQPDGRHIIRVEPEIVWEAGESMVHRIGKYVSRFEAAFRRRPDQWVWFHERYAHAELGRAS